MDAEIWNGYKIRRLETKYFSDLVTISQSAFGLTPKESYFIMKNDTKLWGDPHLGFIAFDTNDKPAAFYGVYACVIEVDGKEIKVVQSGDTMTHKDHTGKGLFTKLAQMTYDLCKELNYEFVFGFPNYNSYPGFVKKLNWVCPGNLNEYRLKVKTLPLVKVAKKYPISKLLLKLYFDLINSFYSEKDKYFENSIFSGGQGGLKRTRGFVNYKLKCGGSYIVSIGGVKVWLKQDGFLYIGDIDVNSNLNFNEFAKELKKYCFLIGADTISFITTPGTFLDNEFKKIATPIESLPYGWCDFNSGIDFSKIGFVMADIDTF